MVHKKFHFKIYQVQEISLQNFIPYLMLVLAVELTHGYKILVLVPFPSTSHFLMFKVFIKELITRGHEVTSISAYPINENLANYTEILIEPKWSFNDVCELSINY